MQNIIDDEGFWKWLIKKWYFWVIIVIHFCLSPRGTGIIISLLSVVAVWSFIFWIIYLIRKGGIHRHS